MWVDFVVGSCFALREMSGVVVLKSLGGRFIFGGANKWRGEGRYRKEALRFKCVVFLLLRKGIRSEKIHLRTKIPQGKNFKAPG